MFRFQRSWPGGARLSASAKAREAANRLDAGLLPSRGTKDNCAGLLARLAGEHQ